MAQHRSSALAGRERLVADRPEWAASHPPAHRRPLPIITREAVERPQSVPTHDRLAAKSRALFPGGFPADYAGLRERAAAIRRETLPDLEGHLRRLTTQVEANGGVVHRAATVDEAARIVQRIATEHGAQLAVKSKSMATEEIDLNARLEEQGVEVVETDLGEYIVQLADERPAHIVAPAVHKSRQDVEALFDELTGADPAGRPAEQLAGFARERLRQDFHGADLGITGVNFAAADTGTLVIVTNEGNADMVTSHPRVHIAVMTVEKVIPRLSDIGVLVPLLSRAAAGQQVSVYQTLVTGPRRADETEGPDELHLVILDNGRTDILGTKYEEVLACIRCGACQLACPVFQTLGGGHAYATVYGGPIGAVLTPLLGDRSEGSDLPYLSSLCGACGEVCPVKIPLPDMLVDLRADHEERQRGAKHRAQRAAWGAWSWLWASPLGYRASIVAARIGGRLPSGLLSRLPGYPRRWSAGRSMPAVREAGTFRRAVRDRRG